MERLILPLFILIAAAQIAVPVYMIFLYEDILKNGVPVRLQARPIDPTDAFRGKYVRLVFENPVIESNNIIGFH